MVYADTMLNYQDWKLLLTIYTDASGKNVDVVINQNNKAIDFLSSMLWNTQHNYTMVEN